MTSVKAREVVHVETAATAVPCEQGFQLWELLENGTQKLVEELLIKTSADLCFIDGDKEKGLDQKAQTVLRSNTKYKLQLSAEVAESILKRSCGSPKVDDDSLQKQVEVLVAQGKVIKSADTARVLLAGFDLCKADLTKADLSSAYLCWTDLSDAKLEQAVLCKAQLGNANLVKAKMIEANLTLVRMHKASRVLLRAMWRGGFDQSNSARGSDTQGTPSATTDKVVGDEGNSGSSCQSKEAVHSRVGDVAKMTEANLTLVRTHNAPRVLLRTRWWGEFEKRKSNIGEDMQGTPECYGQGGGVFKGDVDEGGCECSDEADLTKAILQEVRTRQGIPSAPTDKVVGCVRVGTMMRTVVAGHQTHAYGPVVGGGRGREACEQEMLMMAVARVVITRAVIVRSWLSEEAMHSSVSEVAQMHKANLEKVDLNNANLEKARAGGLRAGDVDEGGCACSDEGSSNSSWLSEEAVQNNVVTRAAVVAPLSKETVHNSMGKVELWLSEEAVHSSVGEVDGALRVWCVGRYVGAAGDVDQGCCACTDEDRSGSSWLSEEAVHSSVGDVANLKEALLIETQMKGAIVVDAAMNLAKLEGLNFENVQFSQHTSLDGVDFPDFVVRMHDMLKTMLEDVLNDKALAYKIFFEGNADHVKENVVEWVFRELEKGQIASLLDPHDDLHALLSSLQKEFGDTRKLDDPKEEEPPIGPKVEHLITNVDMEGCVKILSPLIKESDDGAVIALWSKGCKRDLGEFLAEENDSPCSALSKVLKVFPKWRQGFEDYVKSQIELPVEHSTTYIDMEGYVRTLSPLYEERDDGAAIAMWDNPLGDELPVIKLMQELLSAKKDETKKWIRKQTGYVNIPYLSGAERLGDVDEGGCACSDEGNISSSKLSEEAVHSSVGDVDEGDCSCRDEGSGSSWLSEEAVKSSVGDVAERGRLVLEAIFADKGVVDALGKGVCFLKSTGDLPQHVLTLLKTNLVGHMQTNVYMYKQAIQHEQANIRRVQEMQGRFVALAGAMCAAILVGIANFLKQLAYDYYVDHS
eukprot:gene6924-8261_t